MYTVATEDLSDKAYNAIKRMILRGILEPGEKIYQEKLAEKLGISRTPLYNALSKLDKSLMIESLPRRGFIVKKFTLQELVNLYDVRLRLEPLGAREAAKNTSPEFHKRCRLFLKEYEHVSPQKFSHNFKELDYRFHNFVMEMSENIFIQKMISSYNIISLGNIQLFMEEEDFPKKIDDSRTDHIVILEFILGSMPDNAEEAMYKHIEGTRNIIQSQLERENHGKTEETKS